MAISSGGADRQIDLICGTKTYELSVPGGSSAYQRLESEELPAGTYSIERAASSGNVRIGVIVLKFLNAGGDTTALDQIQSENTYTKILRNGQVFIVREGQIYDLLGHHVE